MDLFLALAGRDVPLPGPLNAAEIPSSLSYPKETTVSLGRQHAEFRTAPLTALTARYLCFLDARKQLSSCSHTLPKKKRLPTPQNRNYPPTSPEPRSPAHLLRQLFAGLSRDLSHFFFRISLRSLGRCAAFGQVELCSTPHALIRSD